MKFKHTGWLLQLGDPEHIHLFVIHKTEKWHEIGECSCGRMVDYTIAQNKYRNAVTDIGEIDFDVFRGEANGDRVLQTVGRKV